MSSEYFLGSRPAKVGVPQVGIFFFCPLGECVENLYASNSAKSQKGQKRGMIQGGTESLVSNHTGEQNVLEEQSTCY